MKRKIISSVCLLVLGVIVFSAPLCRAEDDGDKILSPYFFVEGEEKGADSFPLKSTDVKVRVNGVIADVTVIQKYSNKGEHPINAKYVFPASTRAAVHGMKMTIGEKIIAARVKEKDEAKKEFDEAKKAGKSASLLTQHRPNVFSMNVSNVMPNDDIEIELRYTELLVPVDGIYEFVFPTVVGPRYSSQTEKDAPKDEKWVANPFLKQGIISKAGFNITTEISSGMPINEVSCKSHETDVRFDSQTLSHISLKKPGPENGDRDYLLSFRLSDQKIQSGLMLFEDGDEKFFLLMAQPPKRLESEDIAPREYIFVVDVSGSMNGFPLDTSKALLRDLIGSLKPSDRFNVVLFAGASRLMSSSSVPATVENIKNAISVIDSQSGGGGTELLAGLEKGLSIPRDPSFSRSVLIITDGYIDAEKKVFDFIHQNLSQTNFFAFGIGSSVNRYLIEGISRAGMGESFIVTKPEEASKVSGDFCKYVRNPVLKDISLKYEGFQVSDLEPGVIPEMFAERPVMVIGKWQGEAKGMITVSGKSGKGEYSQTFDVSEIRPMKENSAIKYLWARARIASLSDYLAGPDNPDNKGAVTALGLKYNLLTKYTSFIAVDETIRNKDGVAKDVTQPLTLPKGVSNLAVGNQGNNAPSNTPDVGVIVSSIGGSGASVPEPGLVLMIVVSLGFMAVQLVRRHKHKG